MRSLDRIGACRQGLLVNPAAPPSRRRHRVLAGRPPPAVRAHRLHARDSRIGCPSDGPLVRREPVNGRDLFSRIVYGLRISLLIAFLATGLSVVIGTVFGVISGYFGGWVDTVISRSMDTFLAFPLLLFAIALAGVVPDKA